MTFQSLVASASIVSVLVVGALSLSAQEAASSAGVKVAAEGALRVMSFNIRYANKGDGENQWDHRRELFFSTIRGFNPDLLGLQEVIAVQHDELVSAFPEYMAIGVARDDGARKGEWSPILFRKERFEPLESGTFWLSEHPEEVGSKGWDAALPRICSWVKLRDKATGKGLLYANCHLDHKGVEARRQSALLLRQKLPFLAGNAPLILSGDFNTTEDDPPYRALVAPTVAGELGGPPLLDSYREVHPERGPDEASFHGFKGRVAGSRIDFIFHSPGIRPDAAEIVRDSDGARYPSDHFAVTTIFEPKK